MDLRTIPSVVGGDSTKRHGIVLAKSIPAKKYLIHTGETLYSALKKCPKLVIVPPNFEIYDDFHNKFVSILKQYSPSIEVASIDECYFDYTGSEEMYGDPIEFAYKLKDEIKTKLGFTVNIGVSENKLLAKMASDFSKPDKVHTLYKNEIKAKMWPLPIRELFMLGSKTEAKLISRGFKTIHDIAISDPYVLSKLLGKHGFVLWEYANGIDNSKISTYHILKSISASETLAFDILSRQDAHKQLLKLSENVGTRLRQQCFNSSLIAIEIKNQHFEKYSHQKKLDVPINSTTHIYKNAKKVFDELWQGEPIRNLALSLGILSAGQCEQTNLFETSDNSKYENLDKAIDNLRNKYSKTTIKRATLL